MFSDSIKKLRGFMTKLRNSYNFLFLLILVSAFPVSIAASIDLDNTDSLICKFWPGNGHDGSRLAVPSICDAFQAKPRSPTLDPMRSKFNNLIGVVLSET